MKRRCYSRFCICACGSARNRHLSSQVLPAYGLQDLRSEKRNLPRSSNPNTMCLPNTLGENLGGGRFYLAKKRTFLLCVDTNTKFEHQVLLGGKPDISTL